MTTVVDAEWVFFVRCDEGANVLEVMGKSVETPHDPTLKRQLIQIQKVYGGDTFQLELTDVELMALVRGLIAHRSGDRDAPERKEQGT